LGKQRAIERIEDQRGYRGPKRVQMAVEETKGRRKDRGQ
jgi:hypothetical protein